MFLNLVAYLAHVYQKACIECTMWFCSLVASQASLLIYKKRV
jgi:hypothetical protein